MSAYVTSDCEIKNRDDLVAALEELFGKGRVEVHEDPEHLYGYNGDKRADVANVIVRRRHVGRSSNDVGFLQTETGWNAIVSEFDLTHLTERFNAPPVTAIKTLTAVYAAERAARQRGMKTSRAREGNKIRLTLSR